MNFSYFAGFVCQYQFPELWKKYIAALGITACIAVLIYMLLLRHSRHTKKSVLIALVFVSFIAAHVYYVSMVGGDFVSCGFAPWLAHPISIDGL